jgi:hypothetical protein
MEAQFVYENMRFQRGQDPKSAMSIGAAYKHPFFYLYNEIHKYCSNSKYPEFDKVTKIRMNPKSFPRFKAFTKIYYFQGVGVYNRYNLNLMDNGIIYEKHGIETISNSFISYTRQSPIESLHEWKDILMNDYKQMESDMEGQIYYFKNMGIWPIIKK